MRLRPLVVFSWCFPGAGASASSDDLNLAAAAGQLLQLRRQGTSKGRGKGRASASMGRAGPLCSTTLLCLCHITGRFGNNKTTHENKGSVRKTLARGRSMPCAAKPVVVIVAAAARGQDGLVPVDADQAVPWKSARKGSALAAKGSGDTRQRQCLSRERQWRHKAKAVP